MNDFQSASLAFLVDPGSISSMRVRSHAFEGLDGALCDWNLFQDTVFVGLACDVPVTVAADTLVDLVFRIDTLAASTRFALQWDAAQTCLGEENVPLTDGELTVTNAPPAWEPLEDVHAVAGTEIRFTVGAADPERLPISYSTLVIPGAASFDPVAGEFVWATELGRRADTLAVFSATDGVNTVRDTVLIHFATGYGDVTDDGAISTLDASWVLQYYVRRRLSINTSAADVSGNALVNAHDAALILTKVANPSFDFPVESSESQKPTRAGTRSLSLVADEGAWLLVIDDPTGIRSGGVVIKVRGGASFRARGGALCEYHQIGPEGRLAFVRCESDDPVLARITTSDGSRPEVLSAELNDDGFDIQFPRAARLSLEQNVPNPFNPCTGISVELAANCRIHLGVYDINGRLVRVLFAGERSAGLHRFVWDGCDDAGRAAASGVYIARLTAAGEHRTRRMTLVR